MISDSTGAAVAVAMLAALALSLAAALVALFSSDQWRRRDVSPLVRFPPRFWLFSVAFCAVIPVGVLAATGSVGAAFFVVVGNLCAVNLGRSLLAKKLLTEGKVTADDLA